MASSASRLPHLPLRRPRAAPQDPVGQCGAAGFFCLLSTGPLKFRVFPMFSAGRFGILLGESLALRISADLAEPSG